LERMILFGEDALRSDVRAFTAHYHGERNHQGIGNRSFCLIAVSTFAMDLSDVDAVSAG
jgi:hypothetical protein